MAVHDRYARFTPYELSIPGRAFAGEHFGKIVEEGEAREADLSDPDAFVMLAAAGAALREIRGEEDDPALIEQYGALLFHGFHFWRSGEPFYLLEAGVARFLVDSTPETGDWSADVPSASGYVQLPRHLFWAHSEDDAPAEPLDGFFWTRTPGDSVEILAAMGMREDRPGLGVIPLPPISLEEVGTWTTARVREPRGSKDFESLLPGGEIDRLYSVAAAGEIVKLAGLVLWYMDRFGDAVGAPEGGRGSGDRGATPAADATFAAGDAPATAASPGEAPPAAPEGPLASALPFRRVRLEGGA